MNAKFLIMCCALFAFAACTNKDYAYYEKTARNFLEVMERLDASHERLTGNNFKAGIDSTDTGNSGLQDVSQKIAWIDEAIRNTNEIQHSEKAEAFNAQVLTYFEGVKNDYYGTLRKYLLAKDPAQQVAYREQLISIRKKLGDEEIKSLEIQKKFLDDAGIPQGK